MENHLWRRTEAAKEELRQWTTDNPEATESEVSDVIGEIADTSMPVYNGEILGIAFDNHAMATNEPECGPAFSGEATPINIIAANIYEHIEAALWEEWRRIVAERGSGDETEA